MSSLLRAVKYKTKSLERRQNGGEMKKIITIICALGVTLCMTACGADNETTPDEGQVNQNVETTVSEVEEPEKETVTEPTSVVENTNDEDASTETVAETEVNPEDKVYADFDAWVEELV